MKVTMTEKEWNKIKNQEVDEKAVKKGAEYLKKYVKSDAKKVKKSKDTKKRYIVRVVSLDYTEERVRYYGIAPSIYKKIIAENNTFNVIVDTKGIYSYNQLEKVIEEILVRDYNVKVKNGTYISQIIPESILGLDL